MGVDLLYMSKGARLANEINFYKNYDQLMDVKCSSHKSQPVHQLQIQQRQLEQEMIQQQQQQQYFEQYWDQQQISKQQSATRYNNWAALIKRCPDGSPNDIAWPLLTFIKETQQDNYSGDSFECFSAHKFYNIVQFIQKLNLDTRFNSSNMFLCLALIYANNVMKVLKNEFNEIRALCPQCLLSTCLLLASKYLDDGSINLPTMAEICQLPINYLKESECLVIKALDYNLYVDNNLFQQYQASYFSDPFIKILNMGADVY